MSVHWDPYLEAIDIPPSFECMPAGELESMLNDSIDPDDGQYPPKPEGSALPDSRLSITTEYRPFDALSSPSITDTQLTPSSGYSWLPGEGDGSYGGNEDGADMNSLDVSPISNTSPTATDELAGFVFVERPQPGIPDMVGPGGHLSHLGQHPTSLPSAGPVSAAHSSRAASLVPTQGDATSYRGSYQTNPPSRMDGRYTSPQDSSFVPTALEELGEIDSFATPHDLSTKPFAFVGTTFDPSLGNAALSFPSSQERMQSLAQQDQQQYQQQYLQQHHYQHHHLQQLQTQPQQSLSAVTASQPWQSLPLDTAQLPMHQWTSHPQAITTQILMPHQFQQQQQQQQQHLQQHHLHHHQHRHHVLGPHDHPQHSMLWSSTAALGAGEMLTDSHYIHTTAIQPDPHEATISPASIPVLRSHPESHVTSTATTESAAAPLPIQHRSSATRPRASNRPRTRPLAPGNASHLTAARSATTATGRKGGREKGSHLAEAARAQAHSQRKLGACWGCALQRDPCDGGQTCTRCQQKYQRGQLYIECNRSKLTYFIHDFLPLSMTSMHQKQTIEDDVKKQVLRWDETRGIDVKLTCGYGPPLVWRLFEFKPKTDELLGQLQYLRDENGFVKMHKKWSLPLGIVKLNTGQDDAHFENFLQSALSREHLWEFGWTCFEEETEMDDFQARLLQLMCDLYMATDDPNLQPHLEATLRMMLITYIMGHTITITEETSSDVLSSIQYRDKPAYLPPHTSPRLANRQLKFFFAILRAKIYDKILNWQQQTLHTGRDKAGSWLGSFCATLGFAMVLEEVQRTIQIQAHAKVEKGEMGRDEAMTEAMNACKRIDDGFEFLVKLFRCKYRTRKWTTAGSFGIQTPTLSRPEQVEFCQQTRQLLEEKVEHLRSRENVTFAPENQCLYTSRLVARFLLKFLMTSDGP